MFVHLIPSLFPNVIVVWLVFLFQLGHWDLQGYERQSWANTENCEIVI